MPNSTNTYGSMKPDMKESYSDGKKKKFKRIHKMMQSRGKATAELEMSKNPMGYEKVLKNFSIKGKRGVAA